MRVINYLDVVRHVTAEHFRQYFDGEKNISKLPDEFKRFKKSENYYLIIQALYICDYLYSNVVEKYISPLKDNESEFDDIDDTDDLYNVDADDLDIDIEEYAAYFCDDTEDLEAASMHEDVDDNEDDEISECIGTKKLKSFSTIKEFADNLEYGDFIKLYNDLEFFEEDSYYEKRDLIYELEDKGAFLRKICPMFTIDQLYYCNTYSTRELLDSYYHELSDLAGDSQTVIDDVVKQETETLNMLSVQDNNNFNYVICEMLEDYYKYTKYLSIKGKLDNDDSIQLLKMIESNIEELVILAGGNDVLLSTLIKGYLEYNILSSKEIKPFDDYYLDKDNNEKLDKIKVKSIKIREKLG